MRVSKLAGMWGAACTLALSGLLLAGCASQGQQFTPLTPTAITNSDPTVTPTNPGIERDRISAGDTLIVYFNDTPQQITPMEVTVREDGRITLLQNKDFVAGGSTLGKLSDQIRTFYVPNYYPHMTVSVIFKPETRLYYVGGEVKLPGRQVYMGPVHLLGAIKSAGDFTDFANRKAVRVTRADGRTFIVNCKKALKNPALDVEIYPRDNINVPRRVNPFSF
jgi:protein involved in polysaccharide export with SLBB domain